MTEHGNVEGKRAAVIVALLSEKTIENAARRSGLSQATIYRMLRDESFTDEYRAARQQALSHAIARLQSNSSKAADTLFTIIENPNASAMARVRAIAIVLEYSFRAVELESVLARLDKLERAARGEKDSREWQTFDEGDEDEENE